MILMKVLNDLLEYKGMKIYQDTEMFSFSLDSVLLANFVTINKNINNIMDIGCGNAPIPLILSIKTNAHITGVEIQKEVYNLAIETVLYNNLSKNIEIINADINDLYLKYESDVFDVITCNPPYFKNNLSKKNDSKYKTIARHEIFLNLEKLFKIARKLLKNNGSIAVVHRTNRMIDIISEMKKNNIEPKKIQYIYPKKNMESNLILIEGRKNAKPGIKVLSPLYIHNQDGSYTDSVKNLFKE